jgi:hypothetical protein
MATAARQPQARPGIEALTRDELNFIRNTLAIHNAEIHNPGAAQAMGVNNEELQRRYDDCYQRISHALDHISE